MPDTAPRPAEDPIISVVHNPTDCPFPEVLLTKGFSFGGIPLSEDEIARCLKARRHLGVGVVARLQIACAATPKPLNHGLRPAYAIRARHHIELLVAGRRIHIEAVAQELAGPGGTNEEVRVYVEDVLEGRSIRLGRLGATVNTFPVVARVDGETAMTVTPVTWAPFKEFVVDLWSVRLPARDQARSSLVDDESRGAS